MVSPFSEILPRHALSSQAGEVHVSFSQMSGNCVSSDFRFPPPSLLRLQACFLCDFPHPALCSLSLCGASLQLSAYLGYYYSGSEIICALSRTPLRPLCFLPSLFVPVSHLAIPHPTPSHRNVVSRMVQLASWSATPRSQLRAGSCGHQLIFPWQWLLPGC